MKLSEGVEAAIHAALTLAGLEREATMPASALAGQFGQSPSYLLKHLNALTVAGILQSLPGPAGGYRLARLPEAISLLDIVLAVEGPRPAFRCAEIRQRGPAALPVSVFAKPCVINAAMLRAEKAYRAALAHETLDGLMDAHTVQTDPRAVAAGCAFVLQNQRAQKKSKTV
ncbi:Rrf2 family transcriptional regulator [Mesorhizobium sp. NBSH29]|uniref:RrF2 family transcriptional regulator n=1 Tax=Mesorhizobium sp. NBSH29 TaxID=2654249 RepID=UPI0018964955|nr:Rrf2 family transcriptional regulator [Mesorhizobium sp. NBSH29]QPC88245.1 Rrf2 family transcriptional regulator [Mesorhizobium sp. NBSH29]